MAGVTRIRLINHLGSQIVLLYVFCLRYEFYLAPSLGLCPAKSKCLPTLDYDDDRLLLIPPRLSSISAQRNRAYGQVILSLFNNERRQVDGIASGGAQLP